jgi:hypothetical protein
MLFFSRVAGHHVPGVGSGSERLVRLGVLEKVIALLRPQNHRFTYTLFSNVGLTAH